LNLDFQKVKNRHTLKINTRGKEESVFYRFPARQLLGKLYWIGSLQRPRNFEFRFLPCSST